MKGALSDITILDLTRVLCGPYGMMLLADMGADVIKVETPMTGDDTRSWGPFRNGESVYFASVNRNKRSLTLNLKTEKGKELFRKLVDKADVVIENFRPGVMDKLNLGYEELKNVNPRIIYAAVSGFGSYGPYSERPGYDILAQAMGGIMSITGHPGSPPTRVGASIGDILAGLNINIGILAALNDRNKTGVGSYVEVSLLDSIVSCICTDMMRYLELGVIPERMGNRYAPLAPYDSFQAKDGELIIACGNQKLYELLCLNVLKRPELISDTRFLTMPDRAQNHALLKPYVEQWTKDYIVDEAVALVMEAGIPSGPIYNAEQLAKDEHIANIREMYVELTHPVIGNMKVTGNPVKMADIDTKNWKAAPLLGQHNEEVLQELLGMSVNEIEELKKSGVM